MNLRTLCSAALKSSKQKKYSSRFDISISLPLPHSFLQRTYKTAGHKCKTVSARLASFPITCFSHVDFLCLFEGREKNILLYKLYREISGQELWR